MNKIFQFFKKEIIIPKWIKKSAKFIFISLIITTCLATIAFESFFTWNIFFGKEEPSDSEMIDTAMLSEETEKCNVRGIELYGDLLTYIATGDSEDDYSDSLDQTSADYIVTTVNEAEKDDKIKAIIMEIDSYGGLPTAGEEIANALVAAQKPTVALVKQAGVSAAYLAASGADIIFASKYSDVGGIGITLSYLDYAEKNQKEGMTYNQLSTGKFKDTGNPDKPLTQEERDLIMRDLNITHNDFVKDVAKNRKLPLEKVRQLADGSSMMGQMALENKLIDRLGGIKEVKDYLKKKSAKKLRFVGKFYLC